jgi:hypothetical protein
MEIVAETATDEPPRYSFARLVVDSNIDQLTDIMVELGLSISRKELTLIQTMELANDIEYALKVVPKFSISLHSLRIKMGKPSDELEVLRVLQNGAIVHRPEGWGKRHGWGK